MSLKGQYVKDSNDQTAIIESDEPNEEGEVYIYYGVQDGKEIRALAKTTSLVPVDPPLNARVNGEIPNPYDI